MASSFPILGRWRIVASEDFDAAHLDLCEPAFVLFQYGADCEIAFGAFVANLSCGYSKGMAHFRFEGSDEGDEANGDGWAELQEDGTIVIEMNFDRGDEYLLAARRWSEADADRGG